MFGIFDDIEKLKLISNLSPYITATAGFIVAIIGQFAQTKERLKRFGAKVPYIFIFLGFVVAISGQFIQTKINSHVSFIEKAEVKRFKLTTPEIDADIALSPVTDKHLVMIKIKNNVPIKADWMIVNRKNVVLNGVMLEQVVAVPNSETDTFYFQSPINEKEVLENYVELRFRWRSSYYDEMNHPDHLRGNIVKKYRLINSVPHPIIKKN